MQVTWALLYFHKIPAIIGLHQYPQAGMFQRRTFSNHWAKQINNLKFRVSYGGLGDVSSFLNNGNYYPLLRQFTNQPGIKQPMDIFTGKWRAFTIYFQPIQPDKPYAYLGETVNA